MQAAKVLDFQNEKVAAKNKAYCYHCGVQNFGDIISSGDKYFCCDGCKLIYELINDNGLCDYYSLQSHPGLAQIKAIRADKYAYLDNQDIAGQLYTFTNGDYTIVTFYLPSVHCSSCMWLLEHLSKFDKGISESRLNFTNKDATIHFRRTHTTLRKIVELLATIGYEPYISLGEATKKKEKHYNRQRLYRIGIAGFCFGNVMMMSFPEYLSRTTGIEPQYVYLFRYLNLVLALPVFFYCANEFFSSAWKGLRQRTLNIDAPIALALLVTFVRSVYEIISNTGSGYLDSMCGIVFFMLAGRLLQERTYKSMSFDRDYKSYFPIAVNVVTACGIVNKSLAELKEEDIVEVYNEDVVPADSLVVKGTAMIDYSFVTGETELVPVKEGGMLYAGGKQSGDMITVRVVKPVAGSYLTSLWNHHAFSQNKAETNDAKSLVHILSKYFTLVVFLLAAVTSIYWAIHQPSMLVTSVTAILIVACPCALLLTSTFTNSNILRICSINGLFLRDETVIEQLADISQIVFDKTGTLTQHTGAGITYSGCPLTEGDKDLLYSAIKASRHPNSLAIVAWLGERQAKPVFALKETAGMGVSAIVNGRSILVGSGVFVGVPKTGKRESKASVYVRIDDKVTLFHLDSFFRDAVTDVVPALGQRYKLALLSGDHDAQRTQMSVLFGPDHQLLFNQKPVDKLQFIESQQETGQKVMMVGDGLNDAGALQQSNVGITLTDDVNNFTPACDAILDAKKLALLPAVLRLARASRYIIAASFAVSIIYNIVGIYFSMQGRLSPMVAAILMPCSTLTIVLITAGIGSLLAKGMGLAVRS